MDESPYRQAAAEALGRMRDGPWYIDDLRRLVGHLDTGSGAAPVAGIDACALGSWLASLGPVGKLELLLWANRERLRLLSG